MNLAIRDIRHKMCRFLLTAVGIGLLLMIVMGMAGIYQGLSEDALSFLERTRADLWIVQRGTRGPFAEISRIPRSLEDRVYAVTGVAHARAFVSHTIQREYQGRPLRIVVQGLAWPGDDGSVLPLLAGRPLRQSHHEVLADRSLGLHPDDRIPLGKDIYTVVGITTGMVGQSGDGSAFFTIPDSISIQYDSPGEAIRIEREARRSRLTKQDLGNTQPFLLERAAGPASALPALGTQNVSAIMVNVTPGVDPGRVMRTVSAWSDVTVYTNDVQRDLLLKAIERNRRQLGLFHRLLVVISAIIMALILYTLTLDKVHDVAMLKLMGAWNRVIVSLILQQALLLGVMGYGLAYCIGQWVFPFFPRRVAITSENLVQLAVVVLAISVSSSLLGIWKAMSIRPNEVLS
ncbi:MAG TPA: ABC transporter permease [Sedimentisphaerales bacterium]|jgi:putative ABC transport system permease protein|nr:ABC transporter permease [Sedimentisphaerales bacterium]HNU28326.1 ABC transporter permease [Sedimentisphaerales bacterium]